LLLQAGGQTVYFGELGQDSQTLINYLERNGAPKCRKDANPAEYMLDAIGAGATAKSSRDWAKMWSESKECKAVSEEIKRVCNERKSAEESKLMKDQREYAMPLTTQIVAVTKRSFTSYWRDPNYLLGKYKLCHSH
jgi:ATP-binding cassette, subfamily G (WHITE), member 2, SNQ2